MSNLEELVIDNAQPSSLRAKGLAVTQSIANNPGTTATPGGRNTLVCSSLNRFGFRYCRFAKLSHLEKELPKDTIGID
jgi:hypothetical protein